jgi:hypothetical protein
LQVRTIAPGARGLRQLRAFREIETDVLRRPGNRSGRFASAASPSCNDTSKSPSHNIKHRSKQMPFEKGQSGNPAGRPPGARNKATVMAELLLQGEAEAMTRLAIERAKAGDTAALRMCLDRLLPPCRHRAIEFEIPRLTSAADAAAAMAAITAGVAVGDLTPAEAGELSGLVDRFVRALETTVMEQRVARLERDTARPDADRRDRGDQAGNDDRRQVRDPYDFGDAP